MDFMFEDEVDEIGSDVEAYCPKCKGDTTHVVISKYEDEIRRVQCNPCGDVHSYRKPRGDMEEDVPEPIAAKKRALLRKPTWQEFFAKHGEKGGKPYNFGEPYHENNIVVHPKFGRGFVSEVVSDSKVEVTFKDSRRILVHNRKDMPALPLGAEGDGVPTGAKGKGNGKPGQKPAKPTKIGKLPKSQDKYSEVSKATAVAARTGKTKAASKPARSKAASGRRSARKDRMKPARRVKPRRK